MLGLLLVACTGSFEDSGTGSSTGGPDPSDSGTASDTGQVSTLTLHGQVTCAEPTLRDTDGPMVLLDHGEDWDKQRPSSANNFNYGISLAIEDFNGDGHWDYFLGHATSALLFLGTATDELALDTTPLPVVPLPKDERHWQSRGISASDLDGDGDPDLVVGTSSVGVLVWRNDDGVFTDVTGATGLLGELFEAESIPVGDVDGDGDLDLFLGHDSLDSVPPDPGQDNFLYENDGDLRFSDISDRLSTEDRDGYTQVGTLADLDADGDVDLYITNHRPNYRGSRLLLNDGTGLFEDASEAGLNLSLQGMGVSLGDVNEDGLPDLLISDWSDLVLMESQAPAVWANTAKVRELTPDATADQVVAWGNQLIDIDNDGDLDALIGFGPASFSDRDDGGPEEQPDGLWLRDGEVFVDVAAEWGLRQKRDTRGVVSFDYNGDGWLDVLKSSPDGRAVLWTQRCGDASWLVVDLAQPLPNGRALGARVLVESEGRTWTRWVTGSSTSFVTSAPPQVHFGLGGLDRIDRLTVIWPDGAQDSFEDVDTRQRVSVTRRSL